MRKHRSPLGWPRRDPRHYRFAVPNEVWEYKLRPAEFLILAYLCCRQIHGREGKTISAQATVDTLHFTAATVEKYLATLESKDLVTEDGALTLECETGKFFSLPNGVFLLALPPSAFLVYAYLLYCEDRRTHQRHPSYCTIAGTTGLSLNTAGKSVSILADKSLITVERSCWFNEVGLKRNGNNVYTTLPTRAVVENFYRRQLASGGCPPKHGTAVGEAQGLPIRWGKQSVWLAAGGSQTLLCGLTPTPTDHGARKAPPCSRLWAAVCGFLSKPSKHPPLGPRTRCEGCVRRVRKGKARIKPNLCSYPHLKFCVAIQRKRRRFSSALRPSQNLLHLCRGSVPCRNLFSKLSYIPRLTFVAVKYWLL